jgi:nitroreductase
MSVTQEASVNEIIQARWSPKAFRDETVLPEELRSILEAGRLAASSYNEQPWRFIVATKRDPAAFDRMLQLLVPSNRQWAADAGVLIITAAKRTFSRNGSSNYYALHDAGQALAQMMLQAASLGLHAHAMGGFDHARARTELNIPDDFEIGAAVAIGYAGKSAVRPERNRKSLSDIAFAGTWGNPLDS